MELCVQLPDRRLPGILNWIQRATYKILKERNMSQGRNAHVEFGVPGRLKLTAVIIALSAPEAIQLERMAEQLKDPSNVNFTAEFREGALHVNLEMHTDDHAKHMEAEAAEVIAMVTKQEPLESDDAELLGQISGSGGLAGSLGPSAEDLDAIEREREIREATATPPPAKVKDSTRPLTTKEKKAKAKADKEKAEAEKSGADITDQPPNVATEPASEAS